MSVMRKTLVNLICLIVVFSVSAPAVFAETETERKARLEAELQNVERQILTQQRLVEDKQSERQSLERDMAIIDGQIKQAQLGLQARSVSIKQLSFQIDEKEEMLGVLEDKQRRQKESLADLVRKSASLEDFTLVEVMLSKQTFSEFFADVATYQSLKESLNESLSILQEIKDDTFTQKNQLESKQETEAEMKRIQELEKQEIERKEKDKDKILTVTKGEEKGLSTATRITATNRSSIEKCLI
jgi:septal ring factor EnvC (AmiA/AmiB activator)